MVWLLYGSGSGTGRRKTYDSGGGNISTATVAEQNGLSLAGRGNF